ncbi:hypothetical protein L0Y65_02675 [Candidatus Micrarchaeota archaeon]|nr:hypothetical protein [Candidatus Micrarchaeota archaeon]
MPGLFAVVGKPVLHSLSPQMHNAAFKAQSIDARYIRLASESAEGALQSAMAMGIRGMNVTAPFKEEMASHVTAADANARELGAVNTVLFKGGGMPQGYNTDPDGVSGALEAAGIAVKGAECAVLGAGGAAKAAVLALKKGKAGKITVVNRTPEKAGAIAARFGCESCGLSESGDAIGKADIIVSALGTADRVVRPESLNRGMAVLDAHYSSPSALAQDARKAGCTVIDGREWLLHQGLRAFALFCGKKAPIGVMRKAVYARNPEPKTGNIALVGMMGSGKDSVAKAVSSKKGMPIVSTDAEIEKKAGKGISRIFKDDGEAGFRKLESATLASLKGTKGSAINCGGGIVIRAGNRNALKRLASVVWLWADVRTIMERVPQDGTRPLFAGPEPEKKLRALLFERIGAYAEASDMVVATDGKTPDEIAERILYEIH